MGSRWFRLCSPGRKVRATGRAGWRPEIQSNSAPSRPGFSPLSAPRSHPANPTHTPARPVGTVNHQQLQRLQRGMAPRVLPKAPVDQRAPRSGEPRRGRQVPAAGLVAARGLAAAARAQAHPRGVDAGQLAAQRGAVDVVQRAVGQAGHGLAHPRGIQLPPVAAAEHAGWWQRGPVADALPAGVALPGCPPGTAGPGAAAPGLAQRVPETAAAQRRAAETAQRGLQAPSMRPLFVVSALCPAPATWRAQAAASHR